MDHRRTELHRAEGRRGEAEGDLLSAGAGELLLRCVGSLARADGRVSEAELREIRDIVRELTGLDASVDLVRAVVDQDAADEEPVEFIARRARGETMEVRLLIARACYRVLASDREITGPEVHTFNALLERLELPRAEVLAMLD